jgi:hypothetical protein
MAKCGSCGKTIVFGGVRDQDDRYCNKKCAEQGQIQRVTAAIPPELLQRYISEIHQGNCPKCGGPGPVDVHTSHTVWSMLVLTSTQAHQQVSCRRCGVKAKMSAAVSSGVFGWWAFPWGLFMTPLQIMRNVKGMLVKADSSWPSQQLAHLVKLDLAKSALGGAAKA